MLISKQGQNSSRAIFGIKKFSIQAPPKAAQPLFLHLVVLCQLTLHPNSHQNKISPSRAVRARWDSLAHARTMHSKDGASLNHTQCQWRGVSTRRKIGENWKSLHGLPVIKRLEKSLYYYYYNIEYYYYTTLKFPGLLCED